MTLSSFCTTDREFRTIQSMPYQEPPNEYDLEPVKYCARCYSLKIKYEETTDSEYCGDCGCSDVLTSPIDVWEKLYENRYGHKFAVKGTDPKKSPIFQLPISKLKEKVYGSPAFDSIIHSLYPRFHRGLGRGEALMLLFDFLIRDNRLDDLRLTLLEHYKKRKQWKRRS